MMTESGEPPSQAVDSIHACGSPLSIDPAASRCPSDACGNRTARASPLGLFEESSMLSESLALMLLGALAQMVSATAVATPIHPGCTGAPEYHQLDFWIGDWDTFESDSPKGPSEARAHVDPIAQGCAIHELYEQTDGLIGDSILSYDPVRKQWQQTWVTNRGSIMTIAGNFNQGALVLEGPVHISDGTSVMQRITWKAQDKGVREYAVLSKDNGKTWVPAFDVLFLHHG
jgi:hypothetical protein